jgi:hypothetical protein
MEWTSHLRTNRLPRFALMLGVCLSLLDLWWHDALAGEAGVDLNGAVRDQRGEALTNASIFIYTAGPRLGAGILCPSCYADCRKTAQSGSEGKFKIESLSSNLVFQVLVIAPGHVPTLLNKVDPLNGPLEAVLKRRVATNIPPSQTILGRVLNAEKKPLPNAVVSVNSTTTGEVTSSRPPAGTDPLAITDEHGEFSLQSQGKFDAMSLKVEARGLAIGNFADVRPGAIRREFVLTTGASLTGRVLFQNQPLKDITIGVVGSDRSMGNFTGDFVIRTMENGRFLLANLPPNRNYDLYGEMASVQTFGSLPVRSIRLQGDGSETDAGDLVVKPGFRLSGQVKLADGAPTPEHTRVLLGRPAAWDTLTVELPADGYFEFTNVPAETVTLDTRVKGYRLSERNVSLDHLNPFQLVGRLSADRTNLMLLLEPGQNLRPDYSMPPEEERPNNLPLGGAEGKRTIPNAVTFSGQVLDAETKAPVPQFRITPGLQRNPSMKGWIEWYRGKTVEGTNGMFTLDYALKTGALVLMAEAEGYLPALSDPLTTGTKTSTIKLKQGTGPRGKLLLPDGKPADGVTVCYLAAREQATLTSEGVISVYRNREGSVTITDPEGEFDFPPKLGEGEIYAAGARGFGHCRTSELAAQGKLTLQPWGSVRGRLLQNAKPLAGEAVDLAWPIGGSMERPWFNLPGTRADEEGWFALEKVPPGELELRTRLPVGAGSGTGWTTQTQRKFTLKPGEQLVLGVVEKAPPPRERR